MVYLTFDLVIHALGTVPPSAMLIDYPTVARPSRSQPTDQLHCVGRRAHLVVIVEENEHVPSPGPGFSTCPFAIFGLSTSRPGLDAARPLVQRCIVVAAGIEFLRSVQPAVNEVRR